MPKNRKSYSTKFKLQVIKLAEYSNRKATPERNVHQRNFRNWRK